MKKLFTLLIFGIFMVVTYSCEPEALPQPEAVEQLELIDIKDAYSDSNGREENEQERRDPPGEEIDDEA